MSIGIITNDASPVFQRDIIAGVRMMADRHALDVLVDEIAVDPQQRQAVSLPIADLSGIIVIANVLSRAELIDLHAHGKPITLVSHREPALPIPSVIQNNADGITKLVDFLVRDCGRREIVFVRGHMGQHDGIARQYIFQKRLIDHGIVADPACFITGDFAPEVARQSMRDFLATGQSFDAVLAADYLMACAVLDVLRDSQRDVPDDVAVVGFGDGPEAVESGLTTVGTDVVELGQRAMRQLIAQMRGVSIAGVTWLNAELIERDTTRRVT